MTNIKSKLEEYFSLANTLIKNYDNITKCIKTINKEEKNININIIKNLTYVSKINKNKREIKEYSQKLMKNLKLNFIEDNIKYEEYYFNGLSPKDIEFNDIQINEFKLSWKIDDITKFNIDKNKIKYNVEIRKENEEFKLVYEGNNQNCKIDKLNSDTYYEIRICSVYDNIKCIWSEIKKVKTQKFDSIILNESKRCEEFLNKIYEWTGGKNMELLYRGTRDGMTADKFHNKCNSKGPTISLFKNENGYIFGGYASIDWTSYGNFRSASNSFIFTLTNMYEIAPTKFYNSDTNESIYDHYSYGPTFGRGHDIYIGFTSNNNYTNFPYSYNDGLSKGYSIFKGDTNNYYFSLKEIEVFRIIK